MHECVFSIKKYVLLLQRIFFFSRYWNNVTQNSPSRNNERTEIAHANIPLSNNY